MQQPPNGSDQGRFTQQMPYGQTPYQENSPVPPPYGQPIKQQYQPYNQQPAGQQMPYGQYPPQQPYAQPYPPQQAPNMPPQQQQQRPVQQKPPQKPPRTTRRKEPLKPWVYILIAGIVVLAVAVVIYRMVTPQTAMYATVEAGVLGTRYAGDAVIVRNETLYSQEGISQIDYIAEEGSMVERGASVCTVYTSGFNAKELTTLQSYRDQIKTYMQTLLAADTGTDTRLSSYDSEVLSRALEVQALVQGASGNLINQEQLLENTINDRMYYLKQKYPDDQKLSRLYDDENSQLQRIDSWTKSYAASAPGIISFYNDGYETALNMNTFADFSPAEVRSMFNGTVPKAATEARNLVSIYRLVRNDTWCVLMLCSDSTWTPVKGQTYKMLIESFDSTLVDATVDSFTQSGGELLVRLTVTADVSKVLYIRSCHVQIGENVNSFRVPSTALYYSPSGDVGVVIVQAEGQYFVPVTVIASDSSIAHVVPVSSGYLYEGQTILANPKAVSK